MRCMISPAKKMNVDTDSFAPSSLPQFLPEARTIRDALRAMSPQELQALWGCNDSIARLNIRRLQEMDLETRLTPAVIAYEGIQYRYMAPGVMERDHLDYLQEHLRILSGFYGLLRPFDGVVPYRLEMQAPLALDGHRDLYGFWGDKLAKALLEEEDRLIVNLASREYSRAVEPHLPSTVIFLTCTFGELKGDKVIEKGTLCKMARGQMVRWMAENRVTQPQDLREFRDLGYRFSPTRSTDTDYIFIKGGN